MEGNETFDGQIDTLSAGGRNVSLSGGGGSTSATATIDDNDAATIAFNPTTSIVGEADTPTMATIELVITPSGSSGTVGLDVAVGIDVDQTGGTATKAAGMPPATNDDYGYMNTTLTFNPFNGMNSTSQTVTANILDDIVDDNAETIILSLQALSTSLDGQVTVPLATDDHTITINDNDAPGGVAVFDAVNPGNFRIAFDGTNLEIYEGANLRTEAPIAGIDRLVINGTAGDDTFTIDFLTGNPIPTNGVVFNGGGQATAAGDALAIINDPGTRFMSQTFNYADTASVPANGTDGTVDIVDMTMANRTITFTGLEPIDGGDAMTTTLNLPDSAGGANATLQNHATGGRIEIVDNDGGEFETTNVPNPAVELVVNLGNNGDTLNIEGLDAAFDANLTVNSGTGSDTVNFQTNATDIGSGNLNVSATTVNVNVAVTTANGAIDIDADDDVIFAAAGSIAATGAGSVEIMADADGSGGGALTMAAGASIDAGSGIVDLSADEAIALAGVTTTNAGASALTVTNTSGGITDEGTLTVTGTTTLAAGAANNITFDLATNDFMGAVSITSGNNVTLTAANSLDLGMSTISGTLLAIAGGGTLTDSGPLDVTGIATLAATGDIALNDADNDFSTVAIFSGMANVTLVDSNAIDLGASNITGSLNVTAAGNIADNGTLSVGGITTLAAGATNDITLNEAANNFMAAVSITSADNVTIVDADTLDLGASTISGDLTATATTGNITDSGTVTVAGMAQFTTSAANADVDLDTLAIAGMIGVSTNGATGNATLVNATAIDFKVTTVGGDLTATATAGDITDAASLTITGNSSFTVAGGNSITLDDAGNNFVGTVAFASSGGGNIMNVTVVDGSALDLGALTLDGALDVTAAGAISDSGTLAIAGSANFVTLDNA